MSLVDRIRLFHPPELSALRPFLIQGRRLGWILPGFAGRLAKFPAVFEVGADAVRLKDRYDSDESRSDAVAGVVEALAREGVLPKLRHERYAVARSFYDKPLMGLERSAVPSFGTLAYGVHLNGHVGEGRDMKMWIGRRSRHKATGPLKLDHIVAGGQPLGLSLAENLVKECGEEAAMSPDLARRSRPVGFVSYLIQNYEGIRNDVLFCYDIALPADFRPVNTDGEIEEFYLWPIAQVIETLATTDEFKFNVGLVIIDFLVRHGLIAPDDPSYPELILNLRIRDHFGDGV
ncbi:DUF4743 domain-containing protein [Hypericibacter adhaerens]|uniref:DUF4743 domain-containing protein n=1 Tax=Hypericibacter adhaerens TaxID=2602016 RepID=A0A5J6NA16_9PROT|nr:DUF4743 domain-containing protein [Hypericibacter adhaerens]QEX24466.1 DUF4743 domain-containing protein [Hypericibacter adhaerens]